MFKKVNIMYIMLILSTYVVGYKETAFGDGNDTLRLNLSLNQKQYREFLMSLEELVYDKINYECVSDKGESLVDVNDNRLSLELLMQTVKMDKLFRNSYDCYRVDIKECYEDLRYGGRLEKNRPSFWTILSTDRPDVITFLGEGACDEKIKSFIKILEKNKLPLFVDDNDSVCALNIRKDHSSEFLRLFSQFVLSENWPLDCYGDQKEKTYDYNQKTLAEYIEVVNKMITVGYLPKDMIHLKCIYRHTPLWLSFCYNNCYVNVWFYIGKTKDESNDAIINIYLDIPIDYYEYKFKDLIIPSEIIEDFYYIGE